MIFAVIDLGTNTFNLLIAESQPDGTFQKLYNTKIAVKLGEKGINASYIALHPFRRGLDALQDYRKLIDQYGATRVLAFATSAIRGAENGPDFIERAKEKTNIDITVIDGLQEAELIYYGIQMAVSMSAETSLIMDIGGGSNEFIIANKDGILWKHSFKLGAARLLEKFRPADPINSDEVTEINEHLNTVLQPLWQAIELYQPTDFIGSSGAFESVIDMIAARFGKEPVTETTTEYTVSIFDFNIIYDHILSSTLAERKQTKGLIEMRADMMVISCLLIRNILQKFRIDTFRVSTFSLKEGVIYKNLKLHYRSGKGAASSGA